jgi:hypothetical protein
MSTFQNTEGPSEGKIEVESKIPSIGKYMYVIYILHFLWFSCQYIPIFNYNLLDISLLAKLYIVEYNT